MDPPYLCHLLCSCPQAHKHTRTQHCAPPHPPSTSSTSTTTAIFTARPPREAGFLVTKPALSAHTVLWVPSTIAASLRERTAILDSDRKHDAGVNPASEALQSSRNNNRGLAFDVSVVVKAETRVEINGSSPRGADPLPVARRRWVSHLLMAECL